MLFIFVGVSLRLKYLEGNDMDNAEMTSTVSVAATPASAEAVTEVTTLTEQSVATPENTATQPAAGGSIMSFLPIVLLFAIFYFMMIRPQQRKEKQRQKMISELRAGRKISFAGGLIGTIIEAKEQTFIVELSPNATVEIARGAVAAVLDEPEQK